MRQSRAQAIVEVAGQNALAALFPISPLEHFFASAPKFSHSQSIYLSIMESNKNKSHQEGDVAKAIEEQTAKLPSDIFLWTSVASMGVSLAFKIAGHKHTALFIGQWAAPLLLLGIYNKIVKTQGHD
ncbi:hypothetical protein J2Y45_002962 [Dyadobacter sp. BE34]|uniref:Uncharacterized protein n=2 Tax=Spirosomataceae TaxID=2896860 RepID=A0ABU1QWQ8_9BACT|nr:hypothetical protein [Dyadobacter fermentans]MDR7043511.1 hypothetical protein [Dyadobacter sp. BE242]MDR7197823.1 hypothetical protein [Dyadobacter sp. BE34]MDR7214744.1 hypothetical protein [Dyadobacter sp. BE31]MDR7262279.1 hypothetical protein [Dyadobacter sp. BE32]